MKKVEFNKSFKKQAQIFAVGMLIVFVFLGALFYQQVTMSRMILASILILMIGIFMIYIVRKRAKEASCPHCKHDLFELIEVPRNEKAEFKYCPFCGNEIEV